MREWKFVFYSGRYTVPDVKGINIKLIESDATLLSVCLFFFSHLSVTHQHVLPEIICNPFIDVSIRPIQFFISTRTLLMAGNNAG